MRIEDFSRTFDVHPSVQALVDSVETETGKPVEIRIDKEMKLPATVKVARHRMTYHLVRIHPAQSAVASYLLANKCANILRMKPLHSEDRAVPATNGATMAIAYRAIDARLNPGAEPLPRNVLEYLVGGIINQLNNLPVQIRIERWISEQLPDLAAEQQTFLERDVAESVAGVSTEIERVMPPLVFATGNVMTYAYTRGIGELFGKNFTQPYNRHQYIVRKGKELYEMVDQDDDGTHHGDARLIDRWAESLGIREWYLWHDFESMPESYYEDVQ